MSSLTPAESADLFRREPDRFLDVGVGQVACRQVGSGPDVLFVHGWPVSGATFRLLLPHLVDHVTCHVIDLPAAGSSRVTADTPVSVAGHVEAVRRSVDALGLEHVAVVGHDSGGMIARHAMAGDRRLSAMGLINTEPPDPGWRFTSFLFARHLPGFGAVLGWAAGNPRVRRNKFVLGDAFADKLLLDGEFDEFFLRPLHEDAEYRSGAMRVFKSFDPALVRELLEVHAKITVPAQLVWGDRDPFFPVERARKMVGTFADARLTEIEGAGLFSHEERPVEVAEALLPVLTGS